MNLFKYMEPNIGYEFCNVWYNVSNIFPLITARGILCNASDEGNENKNWLGDDKESQVYSLLYLIYSRLLKIRVELDSNFKSLMT